MERFGGQGYHTDNKTGETGIAVETYWKPNLVWKKNINCVKEPKWGFEMKNGKLPELVDAVIRRGQNRKTGNFPCELCGGMMSSRDSLKVFLFNIFNITFNTFLFFEGPQDKVHCTWRTKTRLL